eukprot:TRINITY_DN10449_c0_g1_i1.p1 TRINITY_DN10449_c0_g1~~TRINITY_DN10449_c0_g1_i1.p1  ORF type:complete len:258 (+),score=63.44 TRINITY_DN10449_c0_g1_i1:165-938(+)
MKRACLSLASLVVGVAAFAPTARPLLPVQHRCTGLASRGARRYVDRKSALMCMQSESSDAAEAAAEAEAELAAAIESVKADSTSAPVADAPAGTVAVEVAVPDPAKRGPVGKVKVFFSGDGKNRQKLAKMGLYAVLSYGFVSNASYAICLSVSWYLASKRSGLSPLAPGQWQFFLSVYGGLFVFNNIIRPARLALSLALAPAFDRLIAFIMAKTKRSRAVATAICVFFVNVLGTTALMSGGILLASLFSGVPVFVPK